MPGARSAPICCRRGAALTRHDLRRAGWGLVLAIVLAGATFAVFPRIDIGVSALFYQPRTGFPLADSATLESFRDLVWNLSIMMFVLSLAGLGFALAKRPLLSLGLRDWGFIALLYILGPILLVNGILKEHWGRARPAEVTEFGGAHSFTPPWLPSDQCATNCSFVSGEVSAAVVLAVAMMMLRPGLARHLPGWGLKIWTLTALAIPLATILQRIVTGRHFLSDTLFATLFMLLAALVLHTLIWWRDGPRR